LVGYYDIGDIGHCNYSTSGGLLASSCCRGRITFPIMKMSSSSRQHLTCNPHPEGALRFAKHFHEENK
jgi:hypothetical protein